MGAGSFMYKAFLCFILLIFWAIAMAFVPTTINTILSQSAWLPTPADSGTIYLGISIVFFGILLGIIALPFAPDNQNYGV